MKNYIMAEFENKNEKTIDSYNQVAREYNRRVSEKNNKTAKPWLDRIVDGLDKEAKILEIASGPGRDALYLQKLGYEVDCTDAASGFVEIMKEKGLKARQLDVLNDQLPDGCQLILASNVLHYFNQPGSRASG